MKLNGPKHPFDSESLPGQIVSASEDEATLNDNVVLVSADGIIGSLHGESKLPADYPERGLLESRAEALWPGDLAVMVRRNIKKVLRSRKWQVEKFEDNHCGKQYEFVFVAQGRNRVLIVARDISDQHDVLSRMRSLAYTDKITGLPNREYLCDQRYHGHAAGDQILLEVRDLLLATCRKSDLVIRWGGDEFVIIAKQSNPGEAEALAETIRSTVAENTFVMDGWQVVRTTCSIGFAAYPVFSSPREDDSLDKIINLADSLMYEAKKQRNAWVGMLGVSDAATSESFNCDDLDAVSRLFRAYREGNLRTCRANGDRQVLPGQCNTAG